jgi:uncharacterized protein YciI
MLPVMRALTIAVLLLAADSVCAQTHPVAAQPAPASQTQNVPVKKTWFVRLIAPRPAFLKDMTENEQKLMEQHFVYWKGKFEKGVCLFGGPVLDPKGIYGVLAIEAASEDEARAIAAADPSVVAGVNRIEVAEMRVAFLKKAQ